MLEHVFGDEFDRYEDLYPEFDKFTKEVYYNDPQNTIDAVYNLYPYNTDITPNKGLTKQLGTLELESITVCRLEPLTRNNAGQTINRSTPTNMQTAEPKGRGPNP